MVGFLEKKMVVMVMNEKRFICGMGFPKDSDNPIRIIYDKIDDKDYYLFTDLCKIMNEQQATIKSKDKQLERLYNYFQDYLKDEMSDNVFSEMWDFVKEDEKWNDE